MLLILHYFFTTIPPRSSSSSSSLASTLSPLANTWDSGLGPGELTKGQSTMLSSKVDSVGWELWPGHCRVDSVSWSSSTSDVSTLGSDESSGGGRTSGTSRDGGDGWRPGLVDGHVVVLRPLGRGWGWGVGWLVVMVEGAAPSRWCWYLSQSSPSCSLKLDMRSISCWWGRTIPNGEVI